MYKLAIRPTLYHMTQGARQGEFKSRQELEDAVNEAHQAMLDHIDKAVGCMEKSAICDHEFGDPETIYDHNMFGELRAATKLTCKKCKYYQMGNSKTV